MIHYSLIKYSLQQVFKYEAEFLRLAHTSVNLGEQFDTNLNHHFKYITKLAHIHEPTACLLNSSRFDALTMLPH